MPRYRRLWLFLPVLVLLGGCSRANQGAAKDKGPPSPPVAAVKQPPSVEPTPAPPKEQSPKEVPPPPVVSEAMGILEKALPQARQEGGEVLQNLVLTLARAGVTTGHKNCFVEARKIVDSLPAGDARDRALAALAGVIAQGGAVSGKKTLFSDANAAAASIGGNVKPFAEAITQIAAAQALAGEHADAKQSYRTARDVVMRAISLGIPQLGSSPEGARSAILWTISYSASDAALRTRDASYFLEALATAHSMRTESNRFNMLRHIAIAQAQLAVKTGNKDLFADALKTAERITDEFSFIDKGEALAVISVAQLEAGEAAEAKKTLDAALKIVQDLKIPSFKGRVLQQIAWEQAKLAARKGDAQLLAEAHKYLAMIPDPKDRESAMNLMALFQVREAARKGDVDQLRAIQGGGAHRIEALTQLAVKLGNKALLNEALGNHGDYLMQKIAIAQAELGVNTKDPQLLRDALATAERIQIPQARIYAFRGVALGQARFGDAAAARESFAKALQVTARVEDGRMRAYYIQQVGVGQGMAGIYARSEDLTTDWKVPLVAASLQIGFAEAAL